MENKVPVKLNKQKLVSVSFEIRFETDEIYSDLVALNLANALVRQGHGILFQLPIMQLPPFARSNDQKFRYTPLFGVKNENMVAQVGPRVLIITAEEYPGWKLFYKAIKDSLDYTSDVFKKIERIGFRTINFFENEDIENHLNTIVQNGIKLEKQNCNFSLIYKDGECRARFSFANDAKISKNGQAEKKGSFIDIDTFFEGSPTNLDEIINTLHDLGKKLFFDSLKQDFIETLEPVYDDN